MSIDFELYYQIGSVHDKYVAFGTDEDLNNLFQWISWVVGIYDYDFCERWNLPTDKL